MNRSVWILNYTRRYNKATRTNSDMIKYMQQVTLEAVLERCTYCRTGVVTDLMNDKAATGSPKTQSHIQSHLQSHNHIATISNSHTVIHSRSHKIGRAHV